MPNTIPVSKGSLRQDSKRIRSSLPADFRYKASLVICELIQEWEIFKGSKTILTYLAMGSEVDLSPLFTQNFDKEWVIPRIIQEGEMIFHVFDPDKLIRHSFGMLEPDKTCATVPTEMIQLTLVPGLAFDFDGWRLGYGGGFYDRFLAHFRGNFAGITFHELKLPQIPHDTHDVPMQYVITEKGIFSTLPMMRK